MIRKWGAAARTTRILASVCVCVSRDSMAGHFKYPALRKMSECFQLLLESACCDKLSK